MIRATLTTLLTAVALISPIKSSAQQDGEVQPVPPPPPPPPAAPAQPAAPGEPGRPGEPRESREFRVGRPQRSPNELRDRRTGPRENSREDQETRLEDANRRRDYSPDNDRERDRDRYRARPMPDGPRREGPTGRSDSERRGEERPEDRVPETPRKPTPYLGVVTVSTPAALAAQLGLPEGFGLLVEDILPDSPAQAAGVQRYDVLKKFDDQQLAEPSQLAALVRNLGKGAEANLTVVRKGQEQKVTIKIGETLLPEDPRPTRSRNFTPYGDLESLRRFPGAGPGAPGSAGDRMRIRDWMRQYQEKLRRYEDQLREWQKKPEGEAPKLPPPPDLPEAPGQGALDHSALPAQEDDLRPADVLRNLRPGADLAPRERINEARMVMRDHDGELQVTVKEGRRLLTVKGPEGDQLFSGPVDTPEQRNAVPQQYRRKLEALEIREREDKPPPPAESNPLRFRREVERPAPSTVQ